MQPYPQYKDSGIEWLGQIPAHWEVKRLKYVFKEVNERSEKGEEELLSVSQYSGVSKKSDKIEDGDFLTNASTLEGYKLVKKHQLVSNIMLAWNGSLAFSEYDGITSPAYCIYEITTDDYYQYFNYLLKTELYKAEFKRNSSGVIESRLRLYTDDFFRIWCILPPLSEQEAIGQYLDEQCGKIAQAIGLQTQQIEQLKRLRQVRIHQAVTRGLDSQVPLKDSGIDWLGQIPAHWEVKRLKYVCTLGKGLTITKENLQDEGIFCVNYGEIHSKYGFELNPQVHRLKCVDSAYLFQNPDSLLKKGDFVFADTSEDIEGSGNFTHLSSDDVTFAGYHTVIARPTNGAKSKFLAYEFDSLAFRNQIRNQVKGVKVYSITQSILKNVFVWFPPLSEQEAIGQYLESVCGQIDRAIALKTQQIELLKSYQQSLINEVVTGKRKVGI